MSHIFSINFNFEGELYSAMLAVRSTSFYIEYQLNMLDNELVKQLPGTKIISTTPERFSFLHTNETNQTPLMEAILNAVQQRVKSVSV